MIERSVVLAGTAIRYVENGHGAPLVCIHGNVASRRWFERVMHVPGARVIALDLPNFGASDPLPGEVSIDAYADAVAGFIRALGLEAAFLAGHSLGGSTAMGVAARNPRLVRGLLLVDGTTPRGLVTPVERHPGIELMRVTRAVTEVGLRAIAPTLADEAFFQQLVDDAMRMAAPAWIGNAVALGKIDYTAGCAGYAGPVIVAWGRKDILVTEAMAKETAAAFPRARLEIIETVGHSLPVEDPHRFAALAAELVKGRSGA